MQGDHAGGLLLPGELLVAALELGGDSVGRRLLGRGGPLALVRLLLEDSGLSHHFICVSLDLVAFVEELGDPAVIGGYRHLRHVIVILASSHLGLARQRLRIPELLPGGQARLILAPSLQLRQVLVTDLVELHAAGDGASVDITAMVQLASLNLDEHLGLINTGGIHDIFWSNKQG